MKKIVSLFFTTLFILPVFVVAQTNTNVSANSSCVITSYLTVGSRGSQVVCLQNKFIQLGLLAPDSATGYFGQQTRLAVKTFQSQNGLSQVGYVGPGTRLALNKSNSTSIVQPATLQPTTVSPTPTPPPSTNQSTVTTSSTVQPTKEHVYNVTTPEWLKDDGYNPTLNPKGGLINQPVNAAQDAAKSPDAQKYAKQFNISQESLSAPITSCIPNLRADFNNDKKVDVFDLALLGNNYNKPVPSAYPKLDIDADGKVGFSELVALAQDFGKAKCEQSVASFKIIDSIGGYVGKPNPFIPGGQLAYTAGDGAFIDNNDPSRGDETKTRAFARSLPYGYYVVIDLENSRYWNDDIRYTTPENAQKAADNFAQVVNWIKNERPDLKVGIYEMVPVSDYYGPAKYGLGVDALNRLSAGEKYTDYLGWARGGVASPVGEWTTNGPWRIDPKAEWTANYLSWQAANDFLKPLAAQVDFVVPQVYSPETGVSGMVGWKYMAIENIKEALRYGKPVYPIIMKSYFEAPQADIEPELFRQRLDVLKSAGANGVIMFDYGAGAQWQQFPWVTQFQNFARDNNLIPSGAAVFTSIDDSGQIFWLTIYVIGLIIAFAYLAVRILLHFRHPKS